MINLTGALGWRSPAESERASAGNESKTVWQYAKKSCLNTVARPRL